MIKVEVKVSDGTWHSVVLKPPVSVGRERDAGVFFGQWRVAKRHADLLLRQGTVWIVDHGSWFGTYVNGTRILAETPLYVKDDIMIAGNRLRARIYEPTVDEGGPTEAPSLSQADAQVPDRAQVRTGNTDPAHAWTMSHHAVGGSPDAIESHVSSSPPGKVTTASVKAWETPVPLAVQLKLHSMLLDALDLRREDVASMSDEHLRARSHSLLVDMLHADPQLCSSTHRESVIQSVLDEALGLGPLERLLGDESITEIMVNRFDEIYVERAGRLHRHHATFTSHASVLAVIDRIVAPIGRRIDESSPMVDARLPDGSRVNAVIAPVALKGATLTIRKFGRRRLTLVELVDLGALSEQMAAFLSLCVTHKKNIVVSGGTGSGKTTLLNILSGLIGTHERVITIEDAAELQLPHEHVVSLEARPANMEGRGRIDIRDLVRNALRMRPDRIVVGECRGAEAFDMLAAMNTGHEGSLTTLHANTPRDALSRLETMIMMAGMDLPLAAVREHIASGIDLIVQQARLGDGRRVITDIAEVCGIDSGGIQLQPLMVRNRITGRCAGIGVLPGFIDTWREQGIPIHADWFDAESG